MTLSDYAKGLDPNGTIARVIELLEQSNDIIKDMPVMEGNLPTGHRGTIRTGLASATWRLLNAGVLPSKGSKTQVDFQCGNLESWSQVDKKLAELGGNVNAFRLSEAIPHVEAVGQEVAQTLFYGNPSAPEEFVGFSSYYDDLSAANASHIINAGGTGSDNSSIWMIDWSDQMCALYPKGTPAGLVHEDKGSVVIQNANGVTGALMDALLDKWAWNIGLFVGDWRKCVRICNIDISNLTTESSAADLRKNLIKAYHRIRNKKNTRIYMNSTLLEFLDIQGRDDAILSGCLGETTLDGEEVMTFRRIPLRLCDQLLETESAIS